MLAWPGVNANEVIVTVASVIPCTDGASPTSDHAVGSITVVKLAFEKNPGILLDNWIYALLEG